MRINESDNLGITARCGTDPAIVSSQAITFKRHDVDNTVSCSSLIIDNFQTRCIMEKSGNHAPGLIIDSEAWRNVQDFSNLTGTECNWVIIEYFMLCFTL